jgi:hypothetical protein
MACREGTFDVIISVHMLIHSILCLQVRTSSVIIHSVTSFKRLIFPTACSIFPYASLLFAVRTDRPNAVFWYVSAIGTRRVLNVSATAARSVLVR